MKRGFRLFTLLLSFVMVLGLCPNAALAATGGQADFSFMMRKTVAQAGSEVPGEQTFTVLLEDANGRTPEYYGITITNCTITTNGTGTFDGSLAGSVDINMVSEAHGWSNDPTTQSQFTCTFTLKEKNDGVEGWSYDSNTYTATVYFYPGTGTAAIDVFDNQNVPLNEVVFVNTYTKNATPTETSETTQPSKPAEPQTPKTGDNSTIALHILLLVLSVSGVAGMIFYRRRNMI